MVYVTQSWDDGVTDDERLIDLLHKHKVKATFNLIGDGYKAQRHDTQWRYQNGKSVVMLARSELPALYRDFEVASHSLNHPHLDELPADQLTWELTESRRRLEDLFQRPIFGFAYPYGCYNDAVKDAVRQQGYVYARTAIPGPEYVGLQGPPPQYTFPPADPMEFGTTAHQLSPNFWEEFARSKALGGLFHFWGHSYEFLCDAMWQDFEEKLIRLNADPEVRWVTNLELFTSTSARA